MVGLLWSHRTNHNEQALQSLHDWTFLKFPLLNLCADQRFRASDQTAHGAARVGSLRREMENLNA